MADWRLQGQEKYLQGVCLSKKRYGKCREGWEHDHCEFCSATFSEREGDLGEGYATQDDYHWVCEKCYDDFKDMFQWKISGAARDKQG